MSERAEPPRLSRLPIDPYLAAIVAMVLLAVLLPCRGARWRSISSSACWSGSSSMAARLSPQAARRWIGARLSRHATVIGLIDRGRSSC